MKKDVNLFREKKAVSEIVGTVILIGIVIVAAALVWVIVNSLVRGQIDSSKSCFGLFEKVNLESRYTCYNTSSGELRFSISIGEVDIDELVVGVSAEGTGISFNIKKTASEVDDVVSYPDRNPLIALPGKNSGLTYILNMSGAGLSGVPDSIKISPIIEGEQCDVSDVLNEINPCVP